ncbi:galactose-specific lectin nattectin-like [Leuresthes tenuis]|uniref:galactose-specific lectin nattectin-like n=1 Tax=Leuresthes tenuis TaxID=355514 RepID=UPI003B50D69B
MRMLTLPLLLCAIMALTRTAAVPSEAETLCHAVHHMTPIKRYHWFVPQLKPQADTESQKRRGSSSGSCTISTMRMLTLPLLFCVMMALTRSGSGESHVVKREAACSPGWTNVNGRCFIYIPKPMSWAQAERNCISMGGHLASVHNAQEYHDIQRLILTATHASKQTWIGGSDAQQNGVWLWTDGSSFGFAYWCEGEPNNYRGWQHCLQINYSDSKCWDDQTCSVRLPSVCSIRK